MDARKEKIKKLVEQLVPLLKLKHVNDCKEKHQSHEVIFDVSTFLSMGCSTADIVGFGSDKEEAIENFIETLAHTFSGETQMKTVGDNIKLFCIGEDDVHKE